MALDVLRYINLASANHRDKAFLKQIRSMVDIPNVQMERFEAQDGSQYPSRYALIDAAAREFPFFFKIKRITLLVNWKGNARRDVVILIMPSACSHAK